MPVPTSPPPPEVLASEQGRRPSVASGHILPAFCSRGREGPRNGPALQNELDPISGSVLARTHSQHWFKGPAVLSDAGGLGLMVAHTCHPCAWEAEAEESRAPSQLVL